MTNAELEGRYRAYLGALNERRLDDLVHYVQDELSYNGKAMTRRQYQGMIAADIAAIPDLIYNAHIIVASGDQVAFSSPARRSMSFLASHRTANGLSSQSTFSTASAKIASQRSGPSSTVRPSRVNFDLTELSLRGSTIRNSTCRACVSSRPGSQPTYGDCARLRCRRHCAA